MRDLAGLVTTPPVQLGSRLLVSLSDRRLACLDFETGKTAWTRKLSDAATGQVHPLPNDRLAVMTRSGLLLALDMANGTSRWEVQLDGTFSQGPWASGNVILVVNEDGEIHASDARDGSQIWSYHSRSRPSSPLVVGEGVVFVAGQDRRVHAISVDYR